MRGRALRSAWKGLAAAMLLVPWIIGCPPGPQPPNGDGGLTGDYVGDEPCAQCHSNIHANWAATLHAGAFQTLEAVGQQANQNCIQCHTTGYGQPGGYVDQATTAALAGVQCEECHGPSRQHVMNIEDMALRPVIPLASETCGRCHTTDTYPQFPQWQQTGHSVVTEDPAQDFFEGVLLSSCGPCHSGDYRFQAIILGNQVPANLLQGVPQDQQHAVECVICHDPHRRTGNAVSPDDNRDFQLRYPEVANPAPSNVIATLTSEDRYNLCGHCHRTRGRTWQATDRGPHPSIQANIYIGEMPMPVGQESTPLVPNTFSTHRFVPGQCATCHMFRQPPPSEFAPPISLHNNQIDLDSCSSATGCHPTPEIAQEDLTRVQSEVQARLDAIGARLGPISEWGYSQEGGPADQSGISDTIKKVRFLYVSLLEDGSLGVHNPPYTRAILTEIETLLTSAGR